MYGKDYGYAQTRIEGTMVRLLGSGEPVYVQRVLDSGMCYLHMIDDENNATITKHIDDLDMHPVPLGYVNVRGDVVYLARIPMRRDWKQGLRQANSWSSKGLLDDIPRKSIRHCIIGKYPTFNKACKDVKIGVARGRNKIIAWHRHWAIETSDFIQYKNHEIVGKLEKGKPVLFDRYKYLKEALEESMS